MPTQVIEWFEFVAKNLLRCCFFRIRTSVHRAWSRAIERETEDPEGAIVLLPWEIELDEYT